MYYIYIYIHTCTIITSGRSLASYVKICMYACMYVCTYMYYYQQWNISCVVNENTHIYIYIYIYTYVHVVQLSTVEHLLRHN